MNTKYFGNLKFQIGQPSGQGVDKACLVRLGAEPVAEVARPWGHLDEQYWTATLPSLPRGRRVARRRPAHQPLDGAADDAVRRRDPPRLRPHRQRRRRRRRERLVDAPASGTRDARGTVVGRLVVI